MELFGPKKTTILSLWDIYYLLFIKKLLIDALRYIELVL